MRVKLLLAALSPILFASCASHRVDSVSNPMKIDTPELARGEKSFMVYCNKCHPGGEKGIGPAVNNKPLPGFLMKTQVRKGLGAMPSFPKTMLPDDELDDLVTYIKALRKQ